MKLTGKNTSLVGAEGHSPPLPFIEVEDAHANRLIALGWAKEYVEGEAEVREPDITLEAPALPEPEPEADEPAAPVEAKAEPSESEASPSSVGVADGEASAAAGESQAEAEADPAAERLREIADHIHLLTDDDLVKSGARAGKPKLDVLSGALGYPVSADDVDAALALEPGE